MAAAARLMVNPWRDLLTADELQTYWNDTAKLDARFARQAKAYWESRTVSQCDALASQAWLCNSSDQYQLARSYAAIWIKK